jgi:hypothetical protein
MSGTGETVLSNRQRKILVKRIKAEQAAAPRPEPGPVPEAYQAPKVDGETAIHVTGKSGKTTSMKLSRLEYLQARGVINGRQYSAGIWFAARWQGYFAPSSSSGIEDQAPGSIPSDPLARWAKGQRTMTPHGKPRTPPPTFRPRKPSEPRRASDGFSHKRLDCLQAWIRARRLVDHLPAFDRKLLIAVAVDGHTLTDGARIALGSAERAGRAERLHRRALEAFWRILDAIADEIEPSVQNLEWDNDDLELAEAS